MDVCVKNNMNFSKKLMFLRFDGKANIKENIIRTLKVKSDDSLKNVDPQTDDPDFKLHC